MPADSRPRRGLKLRNPPWFLLSMAPLVVIALASSAARGFPRALLLLYAFLVVENVALLRWFGIRLTTSEAIVYKLGRRRVPWSQVQAVTQQWYFGSRRIVLWTSGGRVPLRAPIALFGLGGDRFARDFHTIGQWWLAHRGPDWRPHPRFWPAPPPPWWLTGPPAPQGHADDPAALA